MTNAQRNFWGAIIVSFITAGGIMGAAAINRSNKSKPTLSQESAKGNTAAIQGDSNNAVQNSPGAAINTGDNTNGRINSPDVRVTVVLPRDNPSGKGKPKPAMGGICTLDSINHALHIRPQSGTWTAPYVEIPLHDKGTDLAHLSADGQDDLTTAIKRTAFQGDSVLQLSAVNPVSNLTLHYTNLPRFVFFGDKNGPVFMAEFGKP
jgi:hypothetical protein